MNEHKIEKFYRENFQYSPAVSHTMTFGLEMFDVKADEVQFESEDFPYLRLALVDRLIQDKK